MATWSIDLHTFTSVLVGLNHSTPDATYDSYIIQVSISKCKWIISRRYSVIRSLFLDICQHYPILKTKIKFPSRVPLIHTLPVLPHMRENSLKQFIATLVTMLKENDIQLTPMIRSFFALDHFETESIIYKLNTYLKQVEPATWLDLSRLQLYSIVHHKYQSSQQNNVEIENNVNNIVDRLLTIKSLTLHSENFNQTEVDNALISRLARLPLILSNNETFPCLECLEIINIKALPDFFKLCLPESLTKLKWTKSNEENCSGDLEQILSCCCVSSSDGHRPNLIDISFANNNLSMFDGMSLNYLSNSITTLDLSFNELVSFDKLSLLPHLHKLRISHNKIEKMPSSVVFKELEQVVLIGNCIQNIGPLTINSYPKLHYLDLSSNYIKDVADLSNIVNISSLETLILTGNPITTIALYQSQIEDILRKRIIFSKDVASI
ncbi:hypothetical protein GJ496_001637 [Pomphorhynchus laevis]|nr:hypothetical protein GJ496_001637 [Pomphorhynchus laevis]